MYVPPSVTSPSARPASITPAPTLTTYPLCVILAQYFTMFKWHFTHSSSIHTTWPRFPPDSSQPPSFDASTTFYVPPVCVMPISAPPSIEDASFHQRLLLVRNDSRLSVTLAGPYVPLASVYTSAGPIQRVYCGSLGTAEPPDLSFGVHPCRLNLSLPSTHLSRNLDFLSLRVGGLPVLSIPSRHHHALQRCPLSHLSS